jgi:hypothetical protein
LDLGVQPSTFAFIRGISIFALGFDLSDSFAFKLKEGFRETSPSTPSTVGSFFNAPLHGLSFSAQPDSSFPSLASDWLGFTLNPSSYSPHHPHLDS